MLFGRDDEGQYSDDEDMSWKVRRGAVKCLEAVITTRREYILDSLNRISPALVSRFIGMSVFFLFSVGYFHSDNR